MFLDIKLKVYGEELVFGPGIIILLEDIKNSASMKEACTQMGMSYSKGWKIINRAEKALGYELITRQQGGKKGGKCHVTEKGESLITRFNEMNEELKKTGNAVFVKYFPEYREDV